MLTFNLIVFLLELFDAKLGAQHQLFEGQTKATCRSLLGCDDVGLHHKITGRT